MLAAKALLNLEGPFSIEAAIKKIREWKAQEVGERKAAEEIKRAANREKRKIDDLAAKHTAKKICYDTHKKTIENSPAKRLVRRNTEPRPVAGELCPTCGAADVEAAVTTAGKDYLYIYIYVYIFVYIYISIYIYIYINLYIYICTYIFIYNRNIYIYIYVYIFLFIFIYIYIYLCLFVYLYMFIYIYIFIYLYIFIYISIYIYIYKSIYIYM